MNPNTIQTLTVVATIVATAWLITSDINELRGDIKANTVAIEANAKAISNLADISTRAIENLRMEMRENDSELRGLLITHISGHSQVTGITSGEVVSQAQ